MKRFIYTMFIAFVASVATIGVMGLLSPSPGEPARVKDRVISVQEVARHVSAEDCWMAISGSVYALSDYLPKHPAPARVMLDWCGKDATDAFNTKGRGRSHSPAAHALLPHYRIGILLALTDP